MNLLRKNTLVSLAIMIAAGSLLCVTAFAAPAGNDTKGKYAYRGLYQECQKRGEIESPKPPLNPDSKTQAQWERVFKEKDFKQFGCAKEWEALSAQGLDDILAYLWKHAADSPTPAKCK